MNKLFLIPLLFLVVGLFPNVYAVHPLTENGLAFDHAIQSWCYDDPRLDNITLDSNTNRETEITNIIELIRERISNNSRLDIHVDDACDINGNAFSSRNENDPDIIGNTVTTIVIATGEVVNKIIYFNTQNSFTANTSTCSGGSPFILAFVTEHELGHFAGLSHYLMAEPGYPSSDTIMNEEYICTPTELTTEDLNQIDSFVSKFYCTMVKNSSHFLV